MNTRQKMASVRKKINRARRNLESITDEELEVFPSAIVLTLKKVREDVQAMNAAGKSIWKGC